MALERIHRLGPVGHQGNVNTHRREHQFDDLAIGGVILRHQRADWCGPRPVPRTSPAFPVPAQSDPADRRSPADFWAASGDPPTKSMTSSTTRGMLGPKFAIT